MSLFWKKKNWKKKLIKIWVKLRIFKVDLYSHVWPFKRQAQKMVKHTQTIRREIEDELFWDFSQLCGIGA